MKIKPMFLMEGDPEGTGNPGGTPPAFDWAKVKESLPEDIRGDKSLEPITSLEGLAKSFIHSQRAMGKEKISIPDKHATPEDWGQVFRRLGTPEKFEDYKMNLSEGVKMDDAVLKKVSEIAHSKGILPWQMEAVINGFHEAAKGMQEQQTATAQANFQKQVDSLKSAWGKEYEAKVKEANAAMHFLLPDTADQQALVDAGFGSNPAVLRLLANARKLMSDDQLLGSGSGSLAMSPEDALQKARAIQGDPTHPYRNASHPNHKAAKAEVQALYKIAFPE